MDSRNFLPEGAQLESAGNQRRIPIYLLLDVSGSMEGPSINSLRNGLEHFRDDVMGDPFARDNVAVGVITFSDDARLVTNGLQPIKSFQIPALSASGVTRLDRAFQVLRSSLDEHIQKPVINKTKGDGRPIVFVFTDGKPTNDNGDVEPLDPDRTRWKPARDGVVSDQLGGTAARGTVRLYDIYSIGCGPDVENETLKAISTGLAFHVDKDEVGFATFVKLMTMLSIMSAQKQGAGDPGPGPLVDPGDLPPDVWDGVIP